MEGGSGGAPLKLRILTKEEQRRRQNRAERRALHAQRVLAANRIRCGWRIARQASVRHQREATGLLGALVLGWRVRTTVRSQLAAGTLQLYWVGAALPCLSALGAYVSHTVACAYLTHLRADRAAPVRASETGDLQATGVGGCVIYPAALSAAGPVAPSHATSARRCGRGRVLVTTRTPECEVGGAAACSPGTG
jgi:hypothetical protein